MSRVWVIKLGSSLVTNNGIGIDYDALANWSQQIVTLEKTHNIQSVIVCSGAIAEGMARLGWKEKPRDISHLQAAAAVGQVGLIEAWQSSFKALNKTTAQILLTHGDIANRRRYINSRGTLQRLLELGVFAIVNENDTVTADEIRLGDNDNLGAMVANLVEADRLILLTDQEGLMDRNPSQHSGAKLIKSARAEDTSLLKIAGEGGRFGSGGMRTKILAAKRAASSGCMTHICDGKFENIIVKLAEGQEIGTCLTPSQDRLTARKQWLHGLMHTQGTLTLDAGAVDKVQNCGKSLLSIGVTGVHGQFERGDLVQCNDENGIEVARGLANYGSEECIRIKGLASSQIIDALGYSNSSELIHRDNLIIVG